MKVNQSPEFRANLLDDPLNTSQPGTPQQPPEQDPPSKQQATVNPYRQTQVILAIVLVALTTLWVQQTMQRHAPFVRTAQCYFNSVIFGHDSQDIYEGDDVIYWRNGETIDFTQMQGIYSRLASTLKNLETVSLFQRPTNYSKLDKNDADVDMMIIYRRTKPRRSETFLTFNFSIAEMEDFFKETLLNRSFNQHLWKIEMSISVPIVYRGDTVMMNLYFTGQVYSSALLQYKMDVNIINEDRSAVNSEMGEDVEEEEEEEGRLGVRKLPNPHDMELDIPYLNWIIMGLFTVITLLEYRFIMQKNKHINAKIKRKMQEEHQIQRLLGKFDERVGTPETESIDSMSIISLEQIKIEGMKHNVQKHYDIPLHSRIKRIGIYYILELVVSIMAFVGEYNSHNGVICFFAWLKILIYLAQTKNRLMFGFLFEEALPMYLKVELNIVILMTAFVLFNMLVITITNKFQTLELGYFEYLFNYFQYGIYQNFRKAFAPYGMIAQFMYFCQIMLLLYLGNNILISILASQVSKNSMLASVEEMVDELTTECPACGTEFEKGKSKGKKQKDQKEMLVSKIIKDLEFQKSRVHSEISHIENQAEEVHILIKSPTLSPYFPKKNQKGIEKEQFLSPHLKNKKLKEKIRQIDRKVKDEDFKTESRIEAFEELKSKVVSPRKFHIELTDSNVEKGYNNKYAKELRSKSKLLFDGISKFREITKPSRRSESALIKKIQTEVYLEIMSDLLTRVKKMEKSIKR